MGKKQHIVLVTGLALFSMFFGAGNVIFPPYIGMLAGESWFIAFLFYFLADVGLAVMIIFAVLRVGGDVERITCRIGKTPGRLMTALAILCIGPLIAIPRTGATTYEMLVHPLLGEGWLFPTSIVFFGIVLALTMRESSVVDILGRILTPLLLAGLLALIIAGMLHPIGRIAPPARKDTIELAIQSGYQTMDALAALAFGIIIVNTISRSEGELTARRQTATGGRASLLAAAGLLIVYCGLSYLGATVSGFWGGATDRAGLVMDIVRRTLGQTGVVLLGVVVALACLTTAIGLASATAKYFSSLTGGRIRYKTIVIAVCACSALASNLGLDEIILFASPLLNVLYPGIVTLVGLSFFSRRIRNDNAFRGAVLGAILASFIELLPAFGVQSEFLRYFPLAQFGFAWLIPAILGGLIGAAVPSRGRIRFR